MTQAAGEQPLRQGDVLGKTAAVDVVLAAIGDDFVPGLEVRSVNTDSFNHARHIPARDRRKLEVHE